MATSLVCFSCRKENKVELPVGRLADCLFCGADLHCCKNCQFYDPKAYNECLETSADVTKEKDRSNFCDHFVPGKRTGSEKSAAEELKSKAEALFKK